MSDSEDNSTNKGLFQMEYAPTPSPQFLPSYENYGYDQPMQPLSHQHHQQPPSQQLHQQVQNVTIVMQPEPSFISGQPQNIRDWSTGMCGCCEDCNSCCYAYWCYPCFLCTLSTKMNECYCGPHCCGFGGDMLGCFLPVTCPNSFLVAMRTKLRAQYGIKGSIGKDVCCVCCCQFCVVTQMYRELGHLG